MKRTKKGETFSDKKLIYYLIIIMPQIMIRNFFQKHCTNFKLKLRLYTLK